MEVFLVIFPDSDYKGDNPPQTPPGKGLKFVPNAWVAPRWHPGGVCKNPGLPENILRYQGRPPGEGGGDPPPQTMSFLVLFGIKDDFVSFFGTNIVFEP